MTMHSQDWAQLYAPLVGELLKAVFGLIFGKKSTKTKYVERYGDRIRR